MCICIAKLVTSTRFSCVPTKYFCNGNIQLETFSGVILIAKKEGVMKFSAILVIVQNEV